MTIKELIEDLQDLDQSKEIVFVGSIESGRSLSWIEVPDYTLIIEEGSYVFRISGDVDEDGGYQ